MHWLQLARELTESVACLQYDVPGTPSKFSCTFQKQDHAAISHASFACQLGTTVTFDRICHPELKYERFLSRRCRRVKSGSLWSPFSAPQGMLWPAPTTDTPPLRTPPHHSAKLGCYQRTCQANQRHVRMLLVLFYTHGTPGKRTACYRCNNVPAAHMQTQTI